MSRLNREVAIWAHPSGAVAYPVEYSSLEARTLEQQLPPLYLDDPEERQPVTFGGSLPEGTPVTEVVDLGTNNRISCTIAGQRVITVKWVLSE